MVFVFHQLLLFKLISQTGEFHSFQLFDGLDQFLPARTAELITLNGGTSPQKFTGKLACEQQITGHILFPDDREDQFTVSHEYRFIRFKTYQLDLGFTEFVRRQFPIPFSGLQGDDRIGYRDDLVLFLFIHQFFL